MEYDDLPDDDKEWFDVLKHGSASVECDVVQALDEAETLDDFYENVTEVMTELISECCNVLIQITSDSYYVGQLDKLQSTDFPPNIVLSDGVGNKTNYISLNKKSIPFILDYVNRVPK